jgi:hypothetical protein
MMRNIKTPHTVIVYERNGAVETLVRKGHLPARSSSIVSVESLMRVRGVSGEVTFRHHEGVMFGKAGKLVNVERHVV